ncbi:hypothetical protein Tco_1006761 [Tanacetum coccineum]|uniref:Uncharacterized protein n=1 Tax=Tanacetum coccineum TaxID=301880 RepID=A0ABQ5FJZ8_9ASTR
MVAGSTGRMYLKEQYEVVVRLIRLRKLWHIDIRSMVRMKGHSGFMDAEVEFLVVLPRKIQPEDASSR